MKQRKLYVIEFENGVILFFKSYCFDDVLDYYVSNYSGKNASISEYRSFSDFIRDQDELYKDHEV